MLEITHPRAFSFATKEDMSVEDLLGSTTLDETFHLPLSPQALDEVHDLQEISMHLQPSTSPNDVWSYAWGKTEFKASDYYKFCFREADAHPTFSHLWKSHCIMRIKVFGWLLIHDRLNTRNMLKRRHFNIGDDHTCLLCGLQVEETVDHMIFSCSFSQACWSKLGVVWPSYSCRLQLLHGMHQTWDGPLFFFDIFLTAAWSLWKERNNKHFRGTIPSIDTWLNRFIQDFSLLQHRTKEALSASIASFVHSFA